jgi:hypothetical protein
MTLISLILLIPLRGTGPAANGVSRPQKKGLGALLLIVLFAAPPAALAAGEESISAAPGPAHSTLSAFDGHWIRIHDEQDHSHRLSKIETAISDLSWVVRGMASRVLKKSTIPPDKIIFSWDGHQLHQIMGEDNTQFARPVKLDGDPKTLTDSRGEAFSSHWEWTDSGLRVSWVQDQAYGSNLYRVDEKNQALLVEHRIHVTAISNIEPIVYRSSFGRALLPAVPAASDRKEASPGR